MRAVVRLIDAVVERHNAGATETRVTPEVAFNKRQVRSEKGGATESEQHIVAHTRPPLTQLHLINLVLRETIFG